MVEGESGEIPQPMLREVRGKSLPFPQHLLLVYLKPIISGSHVEEDLNQS